MSLIDMLSWCRFYQSTPKNSVSNLQTFNGTRYRQNLRLLKVLKLCNILAALTRLGWREQLFFIGQTLI